jgi:hypothetical protein
MLSWLRSPSRVAIGAGLVLLGSILIFTGWVIDTRTPYFASVLSGVGVSLLLVVPLLMIGVPVLEVLVFVEVGRAVGWLPAVMLLLGLSVLGAASAGFTAAAGRFAPGNRDMPPFDVESTAIDDDLDQLNR